MLSCFGLRLVQYNPFTTVVAIAVPVLRWYEPELRLPDSDGRVKTVRLLSGPVLHVLFGGSVPALRPDQGH